MQEAGPNTPAWSSLPTEPPLPLPLHTQFKIRPFDSISSNSIQNSSYFKIRAILKDIRPLIIEVLRTPNFQDCKAAEEIRANLKILMNLYRQMITETTYLEEFNNFVPEESDQTLRNETEPTQKDQTDQTLQSRFASDEDQDDHMNDRLLIGSSASGWNFIMDRTESKSTYYGMTKKAFRIKLEEWR